jgi:hypothetical protein
MTAGSPLLAECHRRLREADLEITLPDARAARLGGFDQAVDGDDPPDPYYWAHGERAMLCKERGFFWVGITVVLAGRGGWVNECAPASSSQSIAEVKSWVSH